MGNQSNFCKTLFGPTVSICYRQFLNQGDTRDDTRCAKTQDGSSVLPPPHPDFCANPVIVSTNWRTGIALLYLPKSSANSTGFGVKQLRTDQFTMTINEEFENHK